MFDQEPSVAGPWNFVAVMENGGVEASTCLCMIMMHADRQGAWMQTNVMGQKRSSVMLDIKHGGVSNTKFTWSRERAKRSLCNSGPALPPASADEEASWWLCFLAASTSSSAAARAASADCALTAASFFEALL